MNFIQKIFTKLICRFYSLFIILFLSLFVENLYSQTPTPITTVYGDFGGFFTSSTGVVNEYNDSNNLLGFTSDGVTYSTGVNDGILTTNSVMFTPAQFYAFPTPTDITVSGKTLVGIGTNWGGVPQNNSATDFIRTYIPVIPSFFTRDGINGLELATNYFNIPSQTITYDALVINETTSINDAEPDIIVTQTGAPAATDIFKFINSSGATVGAALNVEFVGISKVGVTRWTIYNINPNTGAVNGLFGSGINSPRDLRVLSFKLSDFGITAANFSTVVNFVHTTSGNTDIAFTAYNNSSLRVDSLDTEISVSSASITADNLCAPSTATFVTTVTNNDLRDADDFEVRLALPTGTSPTTSSFSISGGAGTASYDIASKRWLVSELESGKSITLTVNATASGVEFPLSFTATAALLLQIDINPSNNKKITKLAGNCLVDLNLTKTVDKGVLKVGENVTFTLRLKNEGLYTATGIKVSDKLPMGLIYDASNSSVPINTTYDATAGVWDLSTLNFVKDQIMVITIVAKVDASGIKLNKAEIMSVDQTDSDSTHNSNN